MSIAIQSAQLNSQLLRSWDFYLSIDSDLAACERYVSFDEQNYHTHSVEFDQLILRAASEIDSVSSLVTGLDNKEEKKWSALQDKLPTLHKCRAALRSHRVELTPWESWINPPGKERKPPWFDQFTSIKHHRYKCFEKSANLKTALISTTALYLLLAFCIERGESPQPPIRYKSKLFDIPTDCIAACDIHVLPWDPIPPAYY